MSTLHSQVAKKNQSIHFFQSRHVNLNWKFSILFAPFVLSKNKVWQTVRHATLPTQTQTKTNHIQIIT